MIAFYDKFNTYSDNKYSYLRLSAVNVYLRTNTAEFSFVCPEDKYEIANNKIMEIKMLTEKVVSTELKVSIKIKQSHFDPQFFLIDIKDFFNNYASLRGSITKRNIDFDYDADVSVHKVFIALKKSAFSVFDSRGLIRELNDFIYSNYCENIEIEVRQSDEEEDLSVYQQTFSYDNDSGRYIHVTNVQGLIGYTIIDLPTYICDARPLENAVLCGEIRDLKELERKPKAGKKKPNFFKFDLVDGTGSINSICFPSEKSVDKFKGLSEGSEIVASGKLEMNTFMDRSTLTFYINRISLCSLPKDFKVNRIKLNLPEQYKNVFPQPYEEYIQSDLFSSQQRKASDYLKDKTFVVFDLETTGLDRHNDKIIEIGAVKIIDGSLTETFSSFIDPEIPIPERITKLTGISDVDVKDALLLHEVMPDLYKFFESSVLVGHNLESFDFPFLAGAAQKLNIYFDNKRLDTYLLAKEHLSLNQYRLKDLAAHYGIENPNAHRALDDAVTTAKAFVLLSEKFEKSKQKEA